MTTSTPTAEFHTLARLLDTDHGQTFEATHMGGDVWSLVQEHDNGTWVISGDYGLLWYPGTTWGEDGSLATVEHDIDGLDYDTPLDTIAAWAADLMRQARDTEAAAVGREHGAKAARNDATTPHYLVTANADAAASIIAPHARAAYGHAYIDGWYSVTTAKAA